MDDDTYQIIGAAFEVHSRLGSGFLEAVYQEALHHEFDERGIPFRQQVEVPVFYKGQKLQTSYRTDFLCYESIVVELKAISKVGTSSWLKFSITCEPLAFTRRCYLISAPRALNTDGS
jgi:GxxExxY protein